MARLLLLLLLLPALTTAQCLGEEEPFKPGEHLNYDVYYHWGMVWVDAGVVDFRLSLQEYQGQYVNHLQSIGRSKSNWDWVFMVRDTFETYATLREIKPLYFRRTTREGSYRVNNTYTFDRKALTATASLWNNEDGKADTVLHAQECGLDVLSSIYNCRRIDFDAVAENDKVPLRMIVAGEVYDLYVRYLGREETKLKSGKKYRCRKFSILLVKGTIFQGGEDMIVWVTDDRNKVPVKVAAKILVGEVEAQLVSTQGLKYPSTALIE